MINKSFRKWLAYEKRRIARLSVTKSDSSFLEKKYLVLEVLHKLDALSKADKFKSIIRLEIIVLLELVLVRNTVETI